MWCEFEGMKEVASPALVFYSKRIEANIEAMMAMAGSARRLRPHVKTHKCPQIVQMQVRRGITAFKCATIAEAEMTAESGARDILLAYQPVGPTLKRFRALTGKYPDIQFSCLCDNQVAAEALAATGEVQVYIDLDCGMHRTGIVPEKVPALLQALAALPEIRVKGFHVYDGHLHMVSLAERKAAADEVFLSAQQLAGQVPGAEIVIGGSPTFPIHAARGEGILSPGTTLLWDKGYGEKEGLEMFRPAALILARVISTPGSNLYCLDAGHKAISAEHQKPPAIIGLGEFRITKHSEEHMTIETEGELVLGQELFLVPHHICPTVALYDEALVVENQRVADHWPVTARKRKISL